MCVRNEREPSGNFFICLISGCFLPSNTSASFFQSFHPFPCCKGRVTMLEFPFLNFSEVFFLSSGGWVNFSFPLSPAKKSSSQPEEVLFILPGQRGREGWGNGEKIFNLLCGFLGDGVRKLAKRTFYIFGARF